MFITKKKTTTIYNFSTRLNNIKQVPQDLQFVINIQVNIHNKHNTQIILNGKINVGTTMCKQVVIFIKILITTVLNILMFTTRHWFKISTIVKHNI